MVIMQQRKMSLVIIVCQRLHAGKNYSFLRLFDAMYNKEFEGLLLFGSNPVVGGANATKSKESLANLKWMVAVDLWETETVCILAKRSRIRPCHQFKQKLFSYQHVLLLKKKDLLQTQAAGCNIVGKRLNQKVSQKQTWKLFI